MEQEQTEKLFARLKSDVRVSQSGYILHKGLLLECDLAQGTGLADCCKGVDAALYCLQDRDHDGKFDKVKIVAGGRPVDHLYAPYGSVFQVDESEPHWRRAIVYQGSAGGVLRLTYEETTASLPESSHDSSVDVASEGPTEVIYQGLRLSVTKIEPASIEYTVVSGFRKESQP